MIAKDPNLKVKRELADALVIAISLECDRCGEIEHTEAETRRDAVMELFNKGWRVDAQGYPVCKECVGEEGGGE